MPHDISTPVTRNVDLGHGSFLLEFDAPEAIREMEPAQFFMIRIPGSEVLLRRPFSVCGLPGTFDDAADGTMQVLYKVVGRGTALLASLKAGARIDLLGPLGRGFQLPEGKDCFAGRLVICMSDSVNDISMNAAFPDALKVFVGDPDEFTLTRDTEPAMSRIDHR